MNFVEEIKSDKFAGLFGSKCGIYLCFRVVEQNANAIADFWDRFLEFSWWMFEEKQRRKFWNSSLNELNHLFSCNIVLISSPIDFLDQR